MNWLFWAADRLWSYYYQEKKTLAMHDIRHTVAGVGLILLEFLLGSCTLGLLLLSSFFLFMGQGRFSLAVLWTALICSALTFAVWLFDRLFFNRPLGL